ncbi:MAG: hypothetical protein IJP14_01985 [Clostridia bacterium]|nr:hypothetical protein [Clostridia bacterium]
MILVTLGTNDKSFIRLIQEIERLVIAGKIQEEVIVQSGYTKYQSEHLKIFDLIPMDQFHELLGTCSLLITHGGVGTITQALRSGKKVIAVPRLEQYGEHVNDHQLQIIENFAESGFIIPAYQVDQLETALEQVAEFTPLQYTSNTDNMLNLVRQSIG